MVRLGDGGAKYEVDAAAHLVLVHCMTGLNSGLLSFPTNRPLPLLITRVAAAKTRLHIDSR